MVKALSRFLPLLVASSAYAQAEPPVEKASPITVVIFLVLFIGSIAGYFAYTWWNQRRIRLEAEAEKPR